MTAPLVVSRRQLRLGPLLAEGGEGRVYELEDRADQVYKAYRVPQPGAPLADLVGWSASLGSQAPGLAARVRASAAWPLAVVVDGSVVAEGSLASEGWAAAQGSGKGDPLKAAGLLLPKAPRRFALRHRDGRSHLASLSYLTADPDRRSAAYGISLPPPMSAERLGLVYALARLLEGFESASPGVTHGDLSAKNVLWSLARGPEVFVIDCDNGERYDHGVALGPPDRRRAMTPNWDDPAVTPGANPGPETDRYSLALIFLRICGAAHYPIQKRQKAGEAINLEVGIPPSLRRSRSLGPDAAVWDLCARGLSITAPSTRPTPAAWVKTLEGVIEELGATRILDAVWAAQGRSGLVAHPVVAPGPSGPTLRAAITATRSSLTGSLVTVRPVAIVARPGAAAVALNGAGVLPGGPLRRPAGSAAGWTAVRTQTGGVVAGPGAGGVGGAPFGTTVPRPLVSAGPGPLIPSGPKGPSALAQLRALFVAIGTWLLDEHRRTVRYLRTPDRRRRGVLRIPWCLAIDFVTACVVLFVTAMIASPFLGV